MDQKNQNPGQRQQGDKGQTDRNQQEQQRDGGKQQQGGGKSDQRSDQNR